MRRGLRRLDVPLRRRESAKGGQQGVDANRRSDGHPLEPGAAGPAQVLRRGRRGLERRQTPPSNRHQQRPESPFRRGEQRVRELRPEGLVRLHSGERAFRRGHLLADAVGERVQRESRHAAV